MKAVLTTAIGGPEVLELTDVPLAWPGNGDEVLVRLKAAALNPADSFFRSLGAYVESDNPFVLGHDGAGIIEEVGSTVTRFSPGDEVCFCNGGLGDTPGTYAEFAVVPQDQLVVKSPNVSFAQAAALPLVLITCWEALYERANIQAGEFALIHAGAGGTGHMAVQLTALRGGRVATTVSSDEKADFVRGLGAEKPIFYQTEDFVTESRTWTDERGLDVALDNVGADAMQKTYGAMAPYGRIVTLMGAAPDDADETAYVSNLSIHNVMMLTPMVLKLRHKLAAQAEYVAAGMKLLNENKIKIHIDETFDLKDIRAAHERLDAGGGIGKIVVNIGVQ